jgi:ATP-binding cassette subfamily B (MDR/TAP) protein 1
MVAADAQISMAPEATVLATIEDDCFIPPESLKSLERPQLPDAKTVQVKPWQLFRFAGRSEYAALLVGCLFASMQGIMLPYMAVIFGDSIGASATTSASEAMQKTIKEFLYFCGAMFVCSSIWQTMFVWSSERQAAQLRKQYLWAVLHKDIAWFDVNQPAELPTRMTTEVQAVQDAIGPKAGQIVVSTSQFMAGLIVAFTRNDEAWKLALLMCGAIPLFGIGGAYMSNYMGAATGEKQTRYGQAGAIAEEVLMAMRTVASFGGESREAERYHAQLAPAKAAGTRTGFHMGFSFGMVMASFSITYAAAFWFAANHMESSGADVLQVVFATIIGVMALSDLGEPMTKLAVGRASCSKMFPALDEAPVIEARRPDAAGADVCTVQEIKSLSFVNVKFSYPTKPSAPILHGLTLEILQGQKVALVGESGSGKSTAIQLLERFYDPASGEIRVNSMPLPSLPLLWWRRQIGYVGQEPVLFATTVSKNISGGDDTITDEQIVHAAKQARAYEFLEGLPDKLNTFVGIGGGQMSGGQKQRIAIARALVKRPQILLLDEATSALDNESEKQVQATIDALQTSDESHLTTISIAHRLSTIRNSDKIFFLKQGSVCEQGAHGDLMALQGEYFNLVKMQESSAESDGNAVERTSSLVTAAADLTIANTTSEQQSFRATLKKSLSSLGSNGKAAEGIAKLARSGSGEKSKENTVAGGTQKVLKSDDEIEKERLKQLQEQKYKPPLGRLFLMSKPEWLVLPIAFLGPLLSAGVLPVMGYVLSHVIAAFYITPREAMIEEVNTWALWFIGCAVSVWVGDTLKWLCFTYVSECLALRLRDQSFRALLRQDVGFFDDPANNPTGLTTTLERQTKQVSQMTGISFGNAVGSMWGLTCGLVLSFIGSWQLTLVLLAMMPVVMAAIAIVMLAQFGTGGTGSSHSHAGAIAAEAILNIRTVRALLAERQSFSAFSEVIDKVSSKEGSACTVVRKGLAFGFGNSVQFVLYIVGFWYGAKLIDDGKISQADMYQSMFCVMFGMFAAGMAMAFAPDAAKGKLAAYDVFCLLDRPSRVDAVTPSGSICDLGDGSIVLDDVHFHYPHRPELTVLRGLSFSVQRGQSVALVGPSGCGKSTVIQLLQRFYDPSSGRVLVGGTELAQFNVAWWRRQVALVGQEPVLFDMTLEENVRYGHPGATTEQVEAAARKANMDYVFNGKVAWSDSLGIRGGKLSGGQKQRCAIARALVRDPSILLLDEATSALDSVSEREVQKALDAARTGRTTFTIAHRLSTIQDSDLILVIVQGSLAEQGTHDELLAKRGVFYNLAMKGRQ